MNKIIFSGLFYFFFGALLISCGGESKNEEIKKDTVATHTEKYNPAKGMSEGMNITYYPNGQLKMKGEVLQGKRHGIWTTWYENGMKWSENEYNLGALDGKTVSYYKNGQVHYIGYYRGDKKNGKWTFFDEQGTMTKEEEFK